MRIFVIDDEECIRKSFRMYLEESGHEVITIKSPSKYSVMNSHDCNKTKPCDHVFFIDEIMPDTSGLNFIEEMAARGSKCVLRNTYVMSGNLNLTDKGKAEKLGCKLLQKPIKFTEIDQILEECKKNIDPEELSEKEYCNESIEGLAPNSDTYGTQNKSIQVENTRKYERYKVDNCVCLLQVVNTATKFSAWMVDISEGGVQLETSINPKDLYICNSTNQLKILSYSTEGLPVPLTRETLKMVWQNNQVFGCAFIGT